MLTLKAPIQLHIAQGLTGNMDTFGERIRGNYNILGARYAPKDLLFLLTAPPELPEELGGMTTLVTQQNQVDVRSVTMDVVNNVVNRILLDGTEQFTYQDQVYITSVLNRLGITNVQQFMQQVRQLRSENESTLQLTKLYRSEVEKVLQRQTEGDPAPALPIVQKAAEEVPAAAQDPRVTMSLEILQRLNTSNVYETVHSFQRNWTGGVNHFHNNEFRLAEQLRFSNAVSLAEIKQQVYQQPQLHLLHHLNRYEAGVLLEAPQNEEAVLSQAAAAALVTAVDNTVTEVLNRPQLLREQWVQIENAIWQTAENTISRFETYHSQYQLPTEAAEPASQAAWNYYLQELQEYQALYQQLYPKAAEHGRIIGLPPMTRQQMIHLIRMEEGDAILQELENNYHATQESRILRELQSTPAQPVRPVETPPQQLVFRETEPGRETEIRQELRTRETSAVQQETAHTLETLRQLRETQRNETVQPETERVLRELHTREAASMVHPPEAAQEEAVHETVPGTHERQETVLKQQETRERELQRLREVLGRQEEPAVRTAAAVAEALERFRTVREEEPAPETPVRPMTLTPREAEEQAPDILVEEINRIDQHNRTLLQTLQQENRRRETPVPVGPDVKRTMRDALRALEEPESVLREVDARQETTMVHPDYSTQEESLLRQADPASRAVYEKILAYQRDPQGALAQGLIRAASMGSLQAELKRAAQDAPLQLEHPERPGDAERVLLREQSEVVLEQFRNQPGPRVRQEVLRQPGAVQFVHKQAAPDVTEELLEQLQQQRTQTTVKTVTDESITQQHTRQVDVRQMENKVVTQTTEDITELVNRTLARQMRTISDQVYRQMEKRLQSERSRRGRF